MNHCCHQLSMPQTDTLDIIFKLAAILIAFMNVVLAFYVFTRNSKKADSVSENDRKIHLLKTLILDHNLKFFYDLVDKLETKLNELLTNNLTVDQKQEIINSTDDLFISLRRKFTDNLLAVDKDLFEDVLNKLDDLQGSLNSTIFNDGVNLSHKPMFDKMILDPITKAKTEILRVLFNYKG